MDSVVNNHEVKDDNRLGVPRRRRSNFKKKSQILLNEYEKAQDVRRNARRRRSSMESEKSILVRKTLKVTQKVCKLLLFYYPPGRQGRRQQLG